MQDLSVSLFILAGNDINFIIYLVQQIKKGVTDMKNKLYGFFENVLNFYADFLIRNDYRF